MGSPLENIALQLGANRNEQLKLRAERRHDRCMYATEPNDDPEANIATPPSIPCWKVIAEGPGGERLYREPMCDACRRNGPRRQREKALSREHGTMLRQLMSYAARQEPPHAR